MLSNPVLQKTLACVLFIFAGVLLKQKLTGKEHVDGIKYLILTIALPATVFVALLSARADIELLYLPLLALVFNFLLFFSIPFLLKLFGIKSSGPAGRTLRLLLPSLAPGLSSFPYILEYLGERELANAAMADVGNKIFVLVFLFVVAMNWYYKSNTTDGIDSRGKIKSLVFSLLTEPINMVIIIAIVFLLFGINMDSLPEFISSTLSRMSLLMTPLVLLFIGLAVKITKGKLENIISLLLFRSGVSLLISVLIISVLNLNQINSILLAVIFPLSACSFWPFAHIAMFNSKEEKRQIPVKDRTFDMEMAVLVLAISLPFSTVSILTVLSSGEFFAGTTVLIVSSFVLFVLGLIPPFVRKVVDAISKTKVEEKEAVMEAS